MFSRAYQRPQVFPRLPTVTNFPAVFTGYIFSRVYRGSHVFLRFLFQTLLALNSDWLIPLLEGQSSPDWLIPLLEG